MVQTKMMERHVCGLCRGVAKVMGCVSLKNGNVVSLYQGFRHGVAWLEI